MTTDVSAQEQQVVVFDLADERFGIGIHSVREIIRFQAITRTPDAPAAVAGVINLRGSVIPVVDLRHRLNVSKRPIQEDTRILVTETSSGLVGVIVDAVAEVLRLPASAIEPPPAGILHGSNEYVRGIVHQSDSLTILLDLEGALSPDSLSRAGTRPEVDDHLPAPVAVEPSGPSLSTLDVALLETTFAAVKPRAAELVEYFYDQLFQRYPSVIPMFEHADMQEQQGKLLSALALVVANLRNPDALVPALQGLGVRHIGYGAQPAHYEAVGGVLLDSLAYIAGNLWSEQAARAWGDAYTVAATVMIQAAGEAAASGAPR